MYRVRDLMSGRALSITPDASIEAAMDLLRLQQMDLLPVVEDGAVVGLLDSLWLYRFHGELPVREVMQPPVTIDADAPVGEAAARMLQSHLRQLPVTEEGRLIGLLSHRDLLETWGASRDTRTSLPWQDLMRRWAAAQLTAGREIAVLFIDLNDFGQVNKTHGHVAGDRALKTLADALRVCVDPRRDLLCRYAGDEFAIATTRTQEDAWRLVLRIRDEVARLPRQPDEPSIGVSIGIAGGKRRAPRPGDHAPATLDDLINWASRASTQAKTTPGHCVIFEGTGPDGPEFTTEPTPGAGTPTAWREGAPPEGWSGADGTEGRRLAVDTYSITQAEAGVQVDVALRRGEEFYRASATHRDDRLLATAQATAACLQALLVDDARLLVDDVRALPATPEPGIVIALLTLAFPHRQERLLGAVQLGDDRFRSVINAVLDAANRRLALFTRNKDGPAGRDATNDQRPTTSDALGSPLSALGSGKATPSSPRRAESKERRA